MRIGTTSEKHGRGPAIADRHRSFLDPPASLVGRGHEGRARVSHMLAVLYPLGVPIIVYHDLMGGVKWRRRAQSGGPERVRGCYSLRQSMRCPSGVLTVMRSWPTVRQSVNRA
jgi:hypothetical protein